MFAYLLAFAGLSTAHLLILLAVGILLFGKRLPEVGRTLAKGIREFQDGLRGVENDVTGSLARETPVAPLETKPRPPQRITESTPKFVEPDNTNPGSNPPIA